MQQMFNEERMLKRVIKVGLSFDLIAEKQWLID